MIVADSDVLIDYLRGSEQGERVVIEMRSGNLATTVISAFELWAGARTPKQVASVEVLLQALSILPLTASSARAAADVRRDLETRRVPIGMADSLIAGICIDREDILLTRNKKHFERVQGLKLSGRWQ